MGKHITLEQIQDLNKFYSNPVMREMIRAQPEIVREYGPVIQRYMVDTQEKLIEAFLSGEFEGEGGDLSEEEVPEVDFTLEESAGF